MFTGNIPDEWKQLLDVCSKFVTREVTPHVLEADQEYDVGFLRNSLRQLSEIGMLGILVPEELGGTGLEPLAASLSLDILSSGCSSIATALAYHLAAQKALLEGGSEAQKKQWLKAVLDGESEANALSTCIFPDWDPPSREDKKGLALEKEDGFILDGKAGLVVGADLASALAVFVRPRGDLVEGPVTCLMISADRKGIEIGERELFSGLKALPFHPVTFRKVKIVPEDILGKPQKGEGLLKDTRHLLHALIGATAIGLGRNAYSKALTYACERYQYGKTIAHHQEIQRMLGIMLTSLHAGTALYIQSLSGKSMNGILSAPGGDYAKVFCTNAVLDIVLDAIQIHGGYGYMQDYGVEKLMRDVKILQLLEGRNPVLQIDAARSEVDKAEQ